MAQLYQRSWWERGIPIVSGQTNTTDHSTGTITSEIVSANVLQRSVMVTLPDLAASSGLSTGWQVWTPTVPVTVSAVTYYPISAAYVNTSSSGAVLSLYQNSSGLIATLNLFCSTSPNAGSANAFGAVNSTAAAVPANTPLTLGIVAASCTNAPLGQVQIDYTTTG